MSVITRNGSTGVDPDDTLPRKKTALDAVLNFFRRQPLGTAGLVIMIVMFLAAAFANVLAPFDPEENDFQAMMQAPSWTHLLGTDQMGRDIFSRLVYGARTALLVGFSAAFAGGLIGLVLGVASAYFGGWFDLVFQRILDVLMAFPLIILALAVVSVFGTGVFNVILAITIPLIPRCGRVVRASALAVREIPYVDAAARRSWPRPRSPISASACRSRCRRGA
jgi:peptide/nickel transport system permease protein